MQVELYKEVNSPVQRSQVVQLVKTALRALGKNNSVSISVAIVGEKTGKALNKSCRGINSVPSVLSFEETKNKRSFITPIQKEKYIGEIVITDPVVRRRSRENGTSYAKEFDFLFVHGFLHLMGYTHYSDGKANLMEKQENRIINLLVNP